MMRMMFLWVALVLLVAVSANSGVQTNERATTWRDAEASRRYVMQRPKPVKFKHDYMHLQEYSEGFIYELMEKLEGMPLPDDPNYEFIRDRNNQVHACKIPEDEADDDAMEESANPDDVMLTVMRSFADGNCARRVFGEWYYQVCGNMEVKRSPFTYGGYTKKGRLKVIPFNAAESLGVLGRDRKISRHHASVNEPRYVEQTYYDGAKCNIAGDERRMKTTVTFECNPRFVRGYVHINEVREENPCQMRLQLHSTDFCEDKWLLGHVTGTIVCRPYFHPERLKTLQSFFDKYYAENKAKEYRFWEWMEWTGRKAGMKKPKSVPGANKKYVGNWHLDSLFTFEKQDEPYGKKPEIDRVSRTLAYIISELTWAALNPLIPYTEEEQKSRELEEKYMREDDHRRLTNLRNVLDIRRSEFIESFQEGEERSYYEDLTYAGLVRLFGIKALEPLQDPQVHFMAAWLDYIKKKEESRIDIWIEVRPMLIAPNRENAPGSLILLESLIKSDYSGSMRDIFAESQEDKKEEVEEEPFTLFDGEYDENDLEELSRQFMAVYKAVKNGRDPNYDLLTELMDEEDIEY